MMLQIRPHLLAIFKIFLLFSLRLEKNAICVLSNKNKIICVTESISMWISADEACRFTDFYNIICHHDIIMILYRKYN